jgi:hypothetical protein
MLYADTKKEALAIHEKAVSKYNAVYGQVQKRGEQLYQLRRSSISLILEIEELVNSIANRPKEFETILADIRIARQKFKATEDYASEAFDAAKKSGASAAAGIAGGAAVASLAPSAAMWVATTFGTASTGTAISSLSGAVATKAALAWLGGGALSAGGAGVAGGQALLALAGPIGWGIAAASTVASTAALGHKNKQIASQAIEEAKKITIAGAQLNEISAKIQHLIDETSALLTKQRAAYSDLRSLCGADYMSLSTEQQYRLGALVNNTLSLAQLLNKTV